MKDSTDWRIALPDRTRRGVRLWFWSVAAMTFLVLLLGGITRLTQSGLSMVDWQPLMGIIPPIGDAQWHEAFERYRQFPEYKQLRQGMTLGEFKSIFFWEYLHRAAARLIGLVFAVPFVLFWRSRRMSRPLAVRAVALFGLGALQGILGWLMVSSGLIDRPSVSHYRLAAHLAVAFAIFGASVWCARDFSLTPSRPTVTVRTRALMGRGLLVIGMLLAVQIIWGALVAGLDAGFIFNTFPLMAGRIIPPGFMALSPTPLNAVQNIVTVQWLHRLIGTIVLIVGLSLYLRVRRSGADVRSLRLNAALASAIAAQYLLGVLTLIAVVPTGLAVAHQATAMAIAGVWVTWAHHVHHLSVGEQAGTPPAAPVEKHGQHCMTGV